VVARSKLLLVIMALSHCCTLYSLLLVSVEDASKCKRPVSVPGVEVKVKRVVVSICTA